MASSTHCNIVIPFIKMFIMKGDREKMQLLTGVKGQQVLLWAKGLELPWIIAAAPGQMRQTNGKWKYRLYKLSRLVSRLVTDGSL